MSGRYPDGMESPHIVTVDMKCEDGHFWETEMLDDMGVYNVEEYSQMTCPKCKKEAIL